MGVGRRQMLLGGLGLGLAAVAAGPRVSVSREETDLAAFSTYGVVPAGGEIDQTSTLQHAADQAAETGAPLFLPAGVYSTSRLTLKSGTQIEGVPDGRFCAIATAGRCSASGGSRMCGWPV